MQKPRMIIAGALTLLLVAAAFLFLRDGTPSDASAEAGFARDMGTHHGQAVEMSFLVYNRTQDADVRNLAFDIINTQATQRGRFTGWLEQWGLPEVGERPSMAWMAGHAGHGAAPSAGAQSAGAPSPGASEAGMPGMASKEELAKLKSLTGKEAEVLFLQLMIRHHEGGVQMAEALIERSDRDEVVRMAQKIVGGQSGEIKLMTDLLRHRGGRPYPSILTR
ncbi:DUF305 domain-containing protein [Nonomuraea sp. NPDC050328]|uniref:DUF305 domain-containing protein n=1 Tax=Nonomuraea sp. NPDC050328 TaxID=3364361 RepID=UPI0037A59CB6